MTHFQKKDPGTFGRPVLCPPPLALFSLPSFSLSSRSLRSQPSGSRHASLLQHPSVSRFVSLTSYPGSSGSHPRRPRSTFIFNWCRFVRFPSSPCCTLPVWFSASRSSCYVSSIWFCFSSHPRSP